MFIHNWVRILALSMTLLAAGCGGGSSGMLKHQSGQKIAVGEPAPTGLDTAAFIARAQLETCADFHNRLFVIDQKQVFWDRAGNCPDNGYARVLYGKTPDAVQCSTNDSIAGPQTSCVDEQAHPMFDIILGSLDKADLGLGAGHTVVAVPFLQKGIAAVPFELLAQDIQSGVTTGKHVVVKDAVSWEQLWAEHASKAPTAPAPKIDFSKSMVLAVFLGTRPEGCHTTTIRRVYRFASSIYVEHVDTGPGPLTTCTGVMTAPSYMVVVERSDDPVLFFRDN